MAQKKRTAQNTPRQGQGAKKRPAPAAENRQSARKKKKSSSRAHSTAAILGVLCSLLFVGVVLFMLFRIRLAIHDRDRNNASTAEPYRGEVSAVTELSSGTDSAALPASAEPAETTTVTAADPLVVVPDSTAEGTTVTADEKKKPANSITDLSLLRGELEQLTSGFEGNWQVYVRHLDSDTELTIGSAPVYSSGLIDLFASASAYKLVTEGKVDAASADDLVRAMIAMNDGGALERLSELQGRASVTEWCRQQGYWDTELKYDEIPVSTGGSAPDSSSESTESAGGDSSSEGGNTAVVNVPEVQDNSTMLMLTRNTTSVRDTGRLISLLGKDELINKDYSEKLKGFMLAQQDKGKIPEGLPEDTRCVNKAGTSDNACADAAIVYSPTGDYVLVIMGDTPGFGWTADNNFAQISETVYNYFNGEPVSAQQNDEDAESADDTDEDAEDADEDEGYEEDYTEPTGVTE